MFPIKSTFLFSLSCGWLATSNRTIKKKMWIIFHNLLFTATELLTMDISFKIKEVYFGIVMYAKNVPTSNLYSLPIVKLYLGDCGFCQKTQCIKRITYNYSKTYYLGIDHHCHNKYKKVQFVKISSCNWYNQVAVNNSMSYFSVIFKYRDTIK